MFHIEELIEHVAFEALISGVKKRFIENIVHSTKQKLVKSEVGHGEPYTGGRCECVASWASSFL